ncbi:MAG: PEP-CTERM sorting domain-containing protein [Planctomycetes bacterium]|nr:PEP-CTERM sorting domain-containing protein [Planctomycetota bacterium]
MWVPFIATIPEPSTVMLLILLAAGARKASR